MSSGGQKDSVALALEASLIAQAGGNAEHAAADYQRAVDAGDLDSLSNLGVCYLRGVGVGRDEPHAADLFRQAAEKGCEAGKSNLANCYENGIGVAKDAEQATVLYQQAADKDCTIAQYNLGRKKFLNCG